MTVMYLPQSDLPTAQARSNQQALALGCDGVRTQYWWATQQLTDGSAAVVVLPGTAFDATTSNTVSLQPTGLTSDEQATLQSRPQLGTLLPDIITQAQFQALLGDQTTISAIQASPALAKQSSAIMQQLNVDLQDPIVLAFLSDAVAVGTISADTQFTILQTNTLAPIIAQPGPIDFPVPVRRT